MEVAGQRYNFECRQCGAGNRTLSRDDAPRRMMLLYRRQHAVKLGKVLASVREACQHYWQLIYFPQHYGSPIQFGRYQVRRQTKSDSLSSSTAILRCLMNSPGSRCESAVCFENNRRPSGLSLDRKRTSSVLSVNGA